MRELNPMICLAMTALCALPGLAQDASEPPSGPHAVIDALAGTWTMRAPDGSGSVSLSLTPVEIEGVEHALYGETVSSDAPWDPTRQTIFELFEAEDGVRIRSHTLRMSNETLGLLDGMGAAPERFPEIDPSLLVPTMDIAVRPEGDGFSGATPHPYPTRLGGAVEMSSVIQFDGETITLYDTGYDAQGDIVWRGGTDGEAVFTRGEPYAVASELEQGMVVIDYLASGGDRGPEQGDRMFVHYSGYMTDGTLFDSSVGTDRPFAFIYPPGNRAIAGWGMGMEGLTVGARRKLLIPSGLGYGPNGNPRAGIPGDADLVFNVHVERIVTPTAPGQAEE